MALNIFKIANPGFNFLIIIIFMIFNYANGGHIWIEDPVLEFQNAKDLNNNRRGTIWITFML